MKELQKILLLGDSIRTNYQKTVQDNLNGVAKVFFPSENCEHTLFTLSLVDKWIDEVDEIDIIHWNNGLHDVGHNPFRYPNQFSLKMYVKNLEFIYHKLKNTNAKIIWATMTPVNSNKKYDKNEWFWNNDEIMKYNNEALKLMKKNNILINDLYSKIIPNTDKYLGEDGLHLSEAGIKICAESVVKNIKKYI